jgi:hypothetical protein
MFSCGLDSIAANNLDSSSIVKYDYDEFHHPIKLSPLSKHFEKAIVHEQLY